MPLDVKRIHSMIAEDKVAFGLADKLPDYDQEPKTDHLGIDRDCMAGRGRSLNDFYEGALTVLNLLGADEIMSQDDMIKMAREMIHECKYFLESN